MTSAALAAPRETAQVLLTVDRLHAWYADSHVLHGMSFDVREGEVLTLIGRNGAGKTTTLKSIMGIVRKRKGSIRFGASELIGRRTYEIARQGIAYCPEERAIFSSLSGTKRCRGTRRNAASTRGSLTLLSMLRTSSSRAACHSSVSVCARVVGSCCSPLTDERCDPWRRLAMGRLAKPRERAGTGRCRARLAFGPRF